MSESRRCDIFKATDGKWYMTLGNFEHASEDHECTNFGPFVSAEAAEQYLDEGLSNPGAITIEDDGLVERPQELVNPNRGFRVGRGLWS